MIIKDKSAFINTVKNQRIVQRDFGTDVVYIRMMSNDELEAVGKVLSDAEKQDKGMVPIMLDTICNFLVTDKGELLFATDEDKQSLGDSIALKTLKDLFDLIFAANGLNEEANADG